MLGIFEPKNTPRKLVNLSKRKKTHQFSWSYEDKVSQVGKLKGKCKTLEVVTSQDIMRLQEGDNIVTLQFRFVVSLPIFNDTTTKHLTDFDSYKSCLIGFSWVVFS